MAHLKMARASDVLMQDIILSRVVGFLTPNDAEAAMLVSSHFRSSAMSDFHWRKWALTCWADRQLDTFSPKIKEAKETDYRCGWRKLYWDSLEDSKRETLTDDELTRLFWVFSDGEQICDFTKLDTDKIEVFTRMLR